MKVDLWALKRMRSALLQVRPDELLKLESEGEGGWISDRAFGIQIHCWIEPSNC